MATYKLHDNVATMASVSLSPLRDSILLGFKDAKLSVVEYDPYNHNLRTVSLHYFEKEDIKVSFQLFYSIYALSCYLLVYFISHRGWLYTFRAIVLCYGMIILLLCHGCFGH